MSKGGTLHKASFSEELVRIPILATTPPNGIVLDPFAGTGTSILFAKRNGFRSIGIDIKEDYCVVMRDTLRSLLI
jgi:site-specific DNA-methyltransferase (adenine-specific)